MSRSIVTVFLGLCLLVPTLGADPLVHTFSIVARDPATGEMGVAVQSHWFSVGSIVTWAEAGVGAVATQSFVDPGYG
jgi:predicted metal-binding membrane protein